MAHSGCSSLGGNNWSSVSSPLLTMSARSCCTFITRCAIWLAIVIGYIENGLRKLSGFLDGGDRRTYQQTDPIRCSCHGPQPTAGLGRSRISTLGAMPPTINMGIPGASSSVTGGVTGKRVLLAEPRGYCAGVDRAVETVERALEKHGAPVYVRHEIVHNRHVVDTLAKARRRVRRRNRRGARGRDRGVLRPRRRPDRARPAPLSASFRSSTPPARWSPRCTTRPSDSPATTTTSC